jgi:lysyl-tRNA synthetase class 2
VTAGSNDWRPSASLEALHRRATLLATARAFFREREVLEVETPLVCRCTTTEPSIASLPVTIGGREGWLQTSPEHAMKRLLAAGSGPIYQITRAFRDAERGRLHNPEFTILEWYRPGFDHHALMDEVEALLGRLLGAGGAERTTYAEAFLRHAGLDPHAADRALLEAACMDLGLAGPSARGLERDALLDLLLARVVRPALGAGLVFLTDFPASQAALARVRPGPPAVAERFEAFVNGIELANGYHELTDGAEQARRFEADRTRRRTAGLGDTPPDRRLLSALAHGLPPCAGVALGVDRLVMLAVGARDVAEVMAFASERA